MLYIEFQVLDRVAMEDVFDSELDSEEGCLGEMELLHISLSLSLSSCIFRNVLMMIVSIFPWMHWFLVVMQA